MRMPLIAAAVLLIAGCGSNNNSASTADSSKVIPDSSMAMRPIQSPYPVMYSSSFTMDDPKNAESVLALWKSYDNGDLSTAKNLIADSIEIHLWDGTTMKASRDSVTAMIQAHRNMFKSATSGVNAIMAVKSGKSDHWALIWGMEKDVDKKGKADSIELQETWRFNANGQADLLYQFAQMEPKKKGK